MLKEQNIDGDGVEYDQKYRRHLSEGGITFPEAQTVCKALKEKGYNLYIVTNGIEEIQKKRFAKSGLTEYFDKIFISETMKTQKPAKEYFDMVFEEIGSCNKSEYIIIGDSLTSDIKGGIDAGIDTCWCNFRNSAGNSNFEPKYTVENLLELLDIL